MQRGVAPQFGSNRPLPAMPKVVLHQPKVAAPPAAHLPEVVRGRLVPGFAPRTAACTDAVLPRVPGLLLPVPGRVPVPGRRKPVTGRPLPVMGRTAWLLPDCSGWEGVLKGWGQQ
jgi:hypothetical protein